MADMKHKNFEHRVQRIERGHRNLSSGFVKLEERNGLLVPVKKVRSRRGFPWRGLFLVLVVFTLFKATLLAYLGPISYIDQHAKLEQGSIVEQAGAWIMRPDAATVYLSGVISPVVGILNRIAELTT
ncbi:hypothetical protein [Maritimibacter sp. UBA3975]|uniref:hypothetical protein n=1 Tax=Maritimibacter sp. UBA3975 TaxID=1946833 RepID=UPI000C0AA79E|nr:hypothetical protein [Maritimibacter sp. UBA3975]MAM62578.1 hypothetical protein [Maritimibacter sp.]|tara:strand:+ start:8915 stop:9295 length:381 start_codon:yes stop_codon:yes gene_type:complete